MVGNIIIATTLRLIGAGSMSAGLLEVEAASKRAGSGVQLTEARLNSLQRTATRTRAMLAGAFAVGGAVAIAAAVDQAAKFQLAMTSVNNTLGATGSQMRSLNSMALHISGVQAQSATTIAQEMAMVARSGLGSYGRMTALFPLLSRFADVQQFMARAAGQEMDPVHAAGIGVQFSHLFQAYTPAKMEPMLEWLTKLQTVSGEGLDRAMTQARYFVPMGNVLGLSMEQQFELLASMAQTGFLRGRGGSSIGRTFLGAINAATLTGHSQSKQAEALKDLGLIAHGRNQVITAAGTLDWAKFTGIMSGDAARMKPAQYISDLKAGFGVVASQFLSVFSSPAVQEQLKFIKAQFDRLGKDPIGKFFDQLMNDLLPQFQRFVTNFTNLGIQVFLPTLPAITAGFKAMADALGFVGDVIGAHPWVAWTSAISVFGAVSGAALYSVANLWALNRAILAMGTSAGQAAITTNGTLGLLISRIAMIGGAATAAAATLGLLYGVVHEINRVKRHPEEARRSAWMISGANSGMAPPNAGQVDLYGHPILGPFTGVPLSQSGLGNDRFAHVLRQHLSAPLLNALVGGSSSSSVHEVVRAGADRTVQAIHAQTQALVDALSRIGVTINVPAATDKAQQIHRILGAHGPTPPNRGGFATHPGKSRTTGMNYKS